jgi:hypothetical protein
VVLRLEILILGEAERAEVRAALANPRSGL